MIFVTVGTHEQPFDRLLRAIDTISAESSIEFFCQIGYATYVPHARHEKALSFDQMQSKIAEATLVVTHGGPGSIIPLLAAKKPMVLVPRLRRHGEHVDDHQLAFCTRIAAQYGVPVVTNIGDLESAIDAAVAPTARNDEAPEVSLANLRAEIENVIASRSHHGRRRPSFRRSSRTSTTQPPEPTSKKAQ